MSGFLPENVVDFILLYITIPETVVLCITIYGLIRWLKTEKAIRESPFASVLGIAGDVHKDIKRKEPSNDGLLPPP